jgi:hypothetical protein
VVMRATSVLWLLVMSWFDRISMSGRLTSIQQVQRVVQIVIVGQFRVTTKYNEGVTHQQTGVSYAWPRTVSSGRDGVACHASIAHFRQPQIAFDSRATNKATHKVYCAIFRSGCIYRGAITWERITGGEIEAS